MIRPLLFLAWDCSPPCAVRVFRRCIAVVDLDPSSFSLRLLWVAYCAASKAERSYIDARHAEYVSLMMTEIEARYRAVSTP